MASAWPRSLTATSVTGNLSSTNSFTGLNHKLRQEHITGRDEIFIGSTASGEHFANRYQVLGNFVASRGLLRPGGITLDPGSVNIYRAASVATPSGRPRPFNKQTKKGISDHLPLVAKLTY